MNTLNSRLAKLESLAPRGDHLPELIDPVMWERSMQALADALGTTREKAETAIKELANEQPNQ